MNEEDSEQLALQLSEIGFKPADSYEHAHVVLLNTCSVRKKPEDKAFSMLGELAIIKRRRPELVIGVCGCMAQIRAKEIKQRAPHVDFVLGTGDLSQVAGLVEEAMQQRKFQARLELPERKGAIVSDVPQRLVDQRHGKLRAFVPIQYGCDKFCTFCIVPSTRGRERSRPTQDILEEVAKLVALGTKEITLLGQTVNSYGKNLLEGRVPFAKLLNELSLIEGLERIRFMSPYPRDFKADLISVIRDNPKVMECVHLPLQSGDDEVLQSMRRVYTVDGFKEIVRQLREAVPGIALSTDIIVGFPGETDEQFQHTLDVMEEIRFDQAYMFLYSTRPGTPAATMHQVPASVKKERFNRLLEMQKRHALAKHAALVRQDLEVLVDGEVPGSPGQIKGMSRDFKVVKFVGDQRLIGQLVTVQATASHQWGLSAKLIGSA